LSRLLEKLKRISKGEPQGMGFAGMASKARGPGMVLLASLPSTEDHVVERAVAAGVDAMVLTASLAGDTSVLKGLVHRYEGQSWGLWLGGGELPPPDLGLDFLLFSDQEGIPALEQGERARLMVIDPAWGDSYLRAVERLPIDGVVFSVAPPRTTRLAVEHLLSLQRLALLVRKPLLAMMPCPLQPNEVQALREAGLAGLLVPQDLPGWAEALQDLRQTIDGLPPLGRAHRVDVMLPYVTGSPQAASQEEEEE
jgi:hypothetical protein